MIQTVNGISNIYRILQKMIDNKFLNEKFIKRATKYVLMTYIVALN